MDASGTGSENTSSLFKTRLGSELVGIVLVTRTSLDTRSCWMVHAQVLSGLPTREWQQSWQRRFTFVTRRNMICMHSQSCRTMFTWSLQPAVGQACGERSRTTVRRTRLLISSRSSNGIQLSEQTEFSAAPDLSGKARVTTTSSELMKSLSVLSCTCSTTLSQPVSQSRGNNGRGHTAKHRLRINQTFLPAPPSQYTNP